MRTVRNITCFFLLACILLSMLCSCYAPEHQALIDLIKSKGTQNGSSEGINLSISENSELTYHKGLDGITLKIDADLSELGLGDYTFYLYLYDTGRDNLSWDLYINKNFQFYKMSGKLDASEITKETKRLLAFDYEVNFQKVSYNEFCNYNSERTLCELAAGLLIIGLEDLADYLKENNSRYILADYGFTIF